MIKRTENLGVRVKIENRERQTAQNSQLPVQEEGYIKGIVCGEFQKKYLKYNLFENIITH